MDFQYFCGISIFSDYTGRKKKPFLKGGEKMGKTLFAAIKMWTSPLLLGQITKF